MSSIKFFSAIVLVFTFIGASPQGEKTTLDVIKEEISTNDGTIIIERTAHMPGGKTVSGIVAFKPESDKPQKRQAQISNFGKYIFKIGKNLTLHNGYFIAELPDSTEIPFIIINAVGKVIKEEILELAPPISENELVIPKTLRVGYYEKISGNFPGDITKAELSLDGQPADIIAGNEHELYFRVDKNEAGKKNLKLEYGGQTVSEDICLVYYTLNAGRLSLYRGESTFLDVKVFTSEDLKEPILLNVKNISVETVTLNGGENQFFEIIPEMVSSIGEWSKKFDIQSVRTGDFTIETNLFIPEPIDTSGEFINALQYIEDARATGIKSGNIACITFRNPTDKYLKLKLNPCIIPSEAKGQSFTIPGEEIFELPDQSSRETILEGYCNDFLKPPPATGSEIITPVNWIEVENTGTMDDIVGYFQDRELMNPETDLVSSQRITVPGTDVQITGKTGFDIYTEIGSRTLVSALQLIIETYEKLLGYGKISTCFHNNYQKEKEELIQHVFWQYINELTGANIEKAEFEKRLNLTEESDISDFWNTVSLIGVEAKIFKNNN